MRKSNQKWYVRYVLDGVEYSAPTGLEATERNKRKAQQMEAAHRQSVLEGKKEHLRIKAFPFTKAAEMFLSWAKTEYQKPASYARIRSSFSFLMQHFGNMAVASITEGHLEHLKVVRRKMGVKEVSIRHDLHAMSTFFQYAEKQRWCRANPVRKVAMPSDVDAVRMNILTPEQEHRYFAACLSLGRADLYDFGRLMIQQGCRPEEFLELRKDAINLITGQMRIVNGKTRNASRTLKLTMESLAILKRRVSSQVGPFVFPSPRDPQQHRGIHWRGHAEVLKESGTSFVIYDLRHTWASRACMDGMPLPVVAAILGHSPRNLRSVMHYVHVSTADITSETERIEEARSARSRQNMTTETPELSTVREKGGGV